MAISTANKSTPRGPPRCLPPQNTPPFLQKREKKNKKTPGLKELSGCSEEALMVTWAATIAALVSAQPARDSREPSAPPMKMAPGAFQGSLRKPRTKREGGAGGESPRSSAVVKTSLFRRLSSGGNRASHRLISLNPSPSTDPSVPPVNSNDPPERRPAV